MTNKSDKKLRAAKDCFDRLADFRKKRNRCRDYTYGRQWNDIIEVDGRKISEYEYILSEGNVPLKNNLIRRIVRNVLGVFRKSLPEIMASCYAGPLRTIATENSLEEIFTRGMEEFLISGLAVTRKRLGAGVGWPEVSTELVSPAGFFFNTDSRDVRGWDLHTVGQFHFVNFNDWCRAFVGNRNDYRKACEIFGEGDRGIKVIELWQKEIIPSVLIHDTLRGRLIRRRDNEKCRGEGKIISWGLHELWHYYFLTEEGEVIKEGDSPFIDGSHPYVIKGYPFLDGEIQSLVGDMIDQQRYTNRLITLYDWVIRASAKGVLLIPEGAVDPRNLRSVADQWGRFNGVIVYKNKVGNPEPKQISGNMSNLGISELLEIQLKMMEDVSGVNGVLQGNTSGGNVSGQLYNSQTENAMNSLSDITETFRAFIADNASKDALLLSQLTPPL